KLAASWIQTELLRQMNQANPSEDAASDFRIAPKNLAVLLVMIEKGEITGTSAAEIAASEGLQKIDDTSEIERLCCDAIAASPENTAKYRAGNQNVIKHFVGQVMKASRGQANPQAVQETLRRLLG